MTWDSVNICQLKGWVAEDNLLRRFACIEAVDHQVKRDTRAFDEYDTTRREREGHPLGALRFDRQGHKPRLRTTILTRILTPDA